MKLWFQLALRNVWRQKRRTFLTLITMFGGFGVASISIAWSDGTFEKAIDVYTRNFSGHIQIHSPGYLDTPSLYAAVDGGESLLASVQSHPQVIAATPRVKAAGLVAVGDVSAGGRFWGVDITRESSMTRLPDKIISGQSFSGPAANEVLVANGLALALDADPGDTLVVVSQGIDGSLANDAYLVVGIFESGEALVDQTTVIFPIDALRELLVLGDRVHEIALIVDDVAAVPAVARDLQQRLGDAVDVATWQVFAQTFNRAMELNRRGTWVSLLIIFAVVAVGVLNTVLMTVLERTREYGVLRALGTSPLQIVRLVLFEVTIMAVIGVTIGCVLGFAINSVIAWVGIPLPAPISHGGVEFSRLNSVVRAQSFWIPAVCVFASALVVSIFPARRAARTAPALAMRAR